MKNNSQTKIAEQLGISQSYLSRIISAKRRPRWELAKKLADFYGTEITLWMDGSPSQIQSAISKLLPQGINSEV